MRTTMREAEERLQEKSKAILSERAQSGDRLLEKWSKKKNIGEGMIELYDENPEKARGLSFILENQEKHLKSLTETQVSNAFSTTPQNVIKVVRLAYPNSVRGEIFLEWPMETARDVIYYLTATYGSAKRGSTSGDRMLDKFVDRYASEVEEETIGTGDASTVNFTGTLANYPLRPFTVKIFVDGEPVAVDDGAGNLVGTDLDGSGTNTVSYTDGTIDFTFSTAPASGYVVMAQYFFDSEDSDQYTDIGEVHLELRDYLFRAKPWPLGISWTKMTELLLGTTLNIDAEEALISGAADELKKSLDFQALRIGYRYAKTNTAVTFNADFAAAGADSEVMHAQSVTKAFDNAGDAILNDINRGGVTVAYGGSAAVNFVKLHNRFNSTGMQPKIGAHKVGTLDNIGMYKTPTNIVPTNEMICVWKNENVETDAAILFGTLVPLYSTQTLEFREMYKELGVAHFGDYRVTNQKYLRRLVFSGLS